MSLSTREHGPSPKERLVLGDKEEVIGNSVVCIVIKALPAGDCGVPSTLPGAQ